jgi:hypothetical protein
MKTNPITIHILTVSCVILPIGSSGQLYLARDLKL